MIHATHAALHHSADGHRLKAALGVLVYPRQHRRWQSFLAQTPGMTALARLHPCLRYKLYRPYASCQLDCAGRLALLEGHYRYLWQAGARRLVEQAARQALVLACVEGKDGACYRVQLSAIHDSYREGELCLRLMCDDVPLYLASFVFVPRTDGVALQLGALQGVRSSTGAQLVRNATHALHGCRPKNLLVALLRDLGDFFCCHYLFLISNANRIALNPRRRRQIGADYDQAWRELHAIAMMDGNYHLPCQPYRPPALADMASRKRADARRRGELLAMLAHAMRGTLAPLLDSPACTRG